MGTSSNKVSKTVATPTMATELAKISKAAEAKVAKREAARIKKLMTEREERAQELASRIIASLPTEMEKAAKEGARSLTVMKAPERLRQEQWDAIILIGHWAKKQGLETWHYQDTYSRGYNDDYLPGAEREKWGLEW